ncbi:SdpI family protein [Curtobacterium sp. APC 4022]|uniref:SdpI family protein n=1 Tax=Curtobacterium sp. APC 4022 TaxID=3035201 RepID=UPI0025B5BB05|nr:SdpI family protein [Curtobacterium sp. APC 4022]MDN3478154.1 SdpI family protein [Curtobacterium sp. APC 4022]
MIIWSVVSVLVLVMVLVCAKGWIKPNHGIGLRIPATQRGETAWRVGHRAAVPAALTGTAVIVVALIVSLADTKTGTAMMVVAAVAFAGELVWMIFAANRAASRVSVHHP